MDVSININLTPVEARQLIGLPDVDPLQRAMLANIEQKMMEQTEKFSPDALFNTWFSGGSGGFDIFRDMAQGVLSQGLTKEKSRIKSKQANTE
jgi:Family of unknown function (DUF6489)